MNRTFVSRVMTLLLLLFFCVHLQRSFQTSRSVVSSVDDTSLEERKHTYHEKIERRGLSLHRALFYRRVEDEQ